MEIIRVRYEHNVSCSKSNFLEPNDRGLRTCVDCAGIFDEKDVGIIITSKLMDE